MKDYFVYGVGLNGILRIGFGIWLYWKADLVARLVVKSPSMAVCPKCRFNLEHFRADRCPECGLYLGEDFHAPPPQTTDPDPESGQ